MTFDDWWLEVGMDELLCNKSDARTSFEAGRKSAAEECVEICLHDSNRSSYGDEVAYEIKERFDLAT